MPEAPSNPPSSGEAGLRAPELGGRGAMQELCSIRKLIRLTYLAKDSVSKRHKQYQDYPKKTDAGTNPIRTIGFPHAYKKRVVLSGSTVRYDNAFHGWFARRSPSQKS
jgi:hypothetical protein